MIKSMTGYGKSVSTFNDKKITVEIKTLNSKNFNLYTKIPDTFSDKELLIRSETLKILGNGKISLSITIESENSKNITINKKAVEQYYKQIKEIAEEFKHDIKKENIFQIILKLPEVLKAPESQENDDLWKNVFSSVKEALIETDKYRIEEGKALEIDILEKVNKIFNFIPEVEKFEKERIETIKDRLNQKLSEYINKNEKDENRFEQEIIYFLDKFDINEEKTRLTKHCKYFIESADSSDSNGNKLGFITQEIGREVNTLGSKANHAEIQKIVVKMKDELGKMKEQILNIL